MWESTIEGKSDGNRRQTTGTGQRVTWMTLAVLLAIAYANVDLSVLLLEPCRHHTQHAVFQCLGEHAHIQAQGGQALPVENNLQLRVARLQG